LWYIYPLEKGVLIVGFKALIIGENLDVLYSFV
jgi:hypothetical protein